MARLSRPRQIVALCLLALPQAFAAYETDRTTYPVQQYPWYKTYTPQPDQWCVYGGCFVSASFISYNFPTLGGPDDYYLPYCSNDLLIESIWQCSQLYCSMEEAQSTYRILNDPCELYANITIMRPEDALLSSAELAQVPRLNSTEAAASFSDPVNTTAVPDREAFEAGYLTIKAFYENWNLAATLSFAMIGFWGFVILIGIVYRLVELFKRPGEQPQPSWWLWIRRTLILPATFDKHQAEAVASAWTIPPRLESLILTVFVIMNIVICFPGYHFFPGNLYYPENDLALARYIGDRTGYFSIALLPLIWVFSARNNFFMWLTGWSFATFNRFHRWTARLSVLHAVVHSIAWTMYEVIYSESIGEPRWKIYNEAYAEEYWYMGVIATVFMSLMLGASAYFIRHKTYDLFLILHIVLSVVFLATLWYHVRIFNGQFNYWLYCCIAVWLLDRLLRLVRVVVVSVVPRLSKGTRAIATYDRATQIVRLDITGYMPQKPVVPGHFYYLYMPRGLRGYESHPFTLCSWRRPAPVSSPSSFNRSLDDKELGADVRRLPSVDHTSGELAHTLLVRPYKGMTGRLHQKLVKSHESVASTQETIFLEGPYGRELDLSGYSDVLVICGGSGITSAISHSHYLMSKNDSTKVHIAWAVPQRHLPDDVCANELASIIGNTRVQMRVYLTDQAKQEVIEHGDVPTITPYEVRLGRPDVEEVMREYRANTQRSLAVVTCGTAQMSDMCRKAVVRILSEDGVEVGYYNDTLLW